MADAEARARAILDRARGVSGAASSGSGTSSRKMTTEELMEEARRREARRAIDEALGDGGAAPPATPPHQQAAASQSTAPQSTPSSAYQQTPNMHVAHNQPAPHNPPRASPASTTLGGSEGGAWEPQPHAPRTAQPPQQFRDPTHQQFRDDFAAHSPHREGYQQTMYQASTPHSPAPQKHHQEPPQSPITPHQYHGSPSHSAPRQGSGAPPMTAFPAAYRTGSMGSSIHRPSVQENGRRPSEVTVAVVADPYAERSTNGRSQLNPQSIAATTHRLLHLNPAHFTQEDVVELLKVIEVSNRYGREIEHSVEEIAALLERKTLECEGLRRLASENHSTLASAVKSEYNSRIRMETKQSNEIKGLQTKIAAMRVEKDELQQEVEALRMMVRQLQSTPDALNGRETGGDTLFNRLAGSGSTGVVSGGGDGITSWNMPRPSQLVAPQRNLINLVGNMDGNAASKLHSAGVFDFLLVLCQRLCTPIDGREDVYPEMGVAVGQLLQEMRAEKGLIGAGLGTPHAIAGPNGVVVSPPDGSLAHQAATIPIPLVKKSFRQRVIDLYLANNPEDYSKQSTIEDLHRLLEKWDGREDELYRKLIKEYKNRDPTGEFMNRVPTNSSVYSPTMSSEQVAAAVSPTPYSRRFHEGEDTPSDQELHLRVVLMYKKYKPEKLDSKDFGELVRKYPPETLLKALIERYGPEPTLQERKRIVKSIEEGESHY